MPPRPKRVDRAWNASEDVYEVLDPRPGTLLVPRGVVATSSSNSSSAAPALGRWPFAGAAILLVKVCHCTPSIFGLVLGPPSNSTLSEHMCPSARARLAAFASQHVHIGGPVGPHMAPVHHLDKLPGAIQVLPGLGVGGCLLEAQRRVEANKSLAADVAFYSGYAAWPLARLRAEIARGDWGVVHVPGPHVLAGAKAGGLRASALEAML